MNSHLIKRNNRKTFSSLQDNSMKKENKLSLTSLQKVELPFKHEEKRKHSRSMSRTPVERLNNLSSGFCCWLFFLLLYLAAELFSSFAFISNHVVLRVTRQCCLWWCNLNSCKKLDWLTDCRWRNMQMAFLLRGCTKVRWLRKLFA